MNVPVFRLQRLLINANSFGVDAVELYLLHWFFVGDANNPIRVLSSGAIEAFNVIG